MLNLEVDRIYLQQLEYEMDRTDYPVDYNFFLIWYCGHPNFPYTNIQFEQSSVDSQNKEKFCEKLACQVWQ